jgi:hypothetical protein
VATDGCISDGTSDDVGRVAMENIFTIGALCNWPFCDLSFYFYCIIQ